MSISQPCLPVANVGPTRILPHLYLGSQKDVLNKVRPCQGDTSALSHLGPQPCRGVRALRTLLLPSGRTTRGQSDPTRTLKAGSA